MSIRRRTYGALVMAASLALVTACGSGGSTGSDAAGGATTWWHNGTQDPLKSVWERAAAAYEKAHPGAKLDVVPIQNEQFPTKVPLALQSDNPPGVYFNQGGGLLATQAGSGRVADITDRTKSWIKDLGPAAQGWASDGKQYGVPYASHVVGFWYRKDLFAKAGITKAPATLDELKSAVTALKAAGTVPIALGGKDRWPDAFYYNYFAVRECSVETLKSSVAKAKFTDQCFTRAGQDVIDLIALKPFQPGFNGTPAQQGTGSSAGMVAAGQAAMELQGDWNPGVMQGLTADPSYKAELGWFPFPSIAGAAGDPSVALGGGDGFSCTTKQADACVDLLKYLTSAEVQTDLISSGAATIPVNPAAEAAIKDPVVKEVFSYNSKASYVQVYFDVALPTAAGQALNDAVANLFAGQGDAGSVARAVNSAG
ncbi:ABC transporter substrate-binding protein [Kitasatospora herbaricolor]|uniref:Extracellular solute-binding protein n=1 Tax=Kitasatospora herbaricolor TaxID=68217 RepID=A0ABZ1WFQ1_9ACTN|nr:extracellular solute-binding protein [Kitasatospora herbaricolor]